MSRERCPMDTVTFQWLPLVRRRDVNSTATMSDSSTGQGGRSILVAMLIDPTALHVHDVYQRLPRFQDGNPSSVSRVRALPRGIVYTARCAQGFSCSFVLVRLTRLPWVFLDLAGRLSFNLLVMGIQSKMAYCSPIHNNSPSTYHTVMDLYPTSRQRLVCRSQCPEPVTSLATIPP